MEGAPKYSVVIPAYNAETTIQGCLEALMVQTISREDYEIIVVDDGSNDNTAKIAKKYDVVFCRQENQGPAAARNLGAEKARGEIILFTDADCIPAKNWIEEMVCPFLEDPQVVGVKGAYVSHQKSLVARFVQHEYEDRYDLMKKWKYIDFIDTYSAAFKRNVFTQYGGFDTEFRIAMGEDTELSFRLYANNYKMVFQPSAVVAHHHPSTLRRYLKRKYNAALWRILILRKHPNKIRRDSHTPQLIKIQLVCTLLLPLGVLAPFTLKYGSQVLIAIAALTLASFSPPTVKIFRRDTVLGFLAPLFLFLRSGAYILGLATGLFRFTKRK